MDHFPNIGLQIIEDQHIGDQVRVEIQRTWAQRLFTRPWKPFQKYRYETYWKDNGNIFSISGKLIMHPDTAAKMREAIKSPLCN